MTRVETIGVYRDTPLTADPTSAVAFAVIGWLVVLAILLFAIYRWYKKPVGVAKKT